MREVFFFFVECFGEGRRGAADEGEGNAHFSPFPKRKKKTMLGARPLKRAITALVEDPLSDALLSGALEEGDVARLDDVSGEPDGAYSKVPGAVVGAAGVVCTSVKPGQARRRGGGSGSGGGGNTTLKSEVVYSTLSARRAAKEAARAKEQEKEDVKA